MTHLPILPILIPAFAGFLLAVFSRAPLGLQRGFSLAVTVAGLVVSVVALGTATDGPVAYAVSNWPAPFGIILVLDRLSGLMVTLTYVTALVALLGAVRGWDRRGQLFHALFQFQLMGITGAFLTGDIFNLFVFFEILLIASYGLLLHGQGRYRTRAGIKYVVVNLTASALFLLGVGLLYGITGTLNMADLAVKIPQVPASDLGLLRASALVLLVVFGVKAAMLPLSFWLPDAYSAASAPVAALFAVMTKIGVYAILRVYSLAFGADAGPLANLAGPWLLSLGLATLAVATLGVLAARSFRGMVSYLNIASVGTILAAMGLFTTAAVGAALYYLVHSTLTVAGLFLLADAVRTGRGERADQLQPGPAMPRAGATAALYLALAMAVVGFPPLSGFLGKALILQGTLGTGWTATLWATVLVTGLLTLVAASRAGSVLFWKTQDGAAPEATASVGLAPATLALALVVALSALAGPAVRFTQATAASLLEPAAYVEAVLSNRAVVDPGSGEEGGG